MNVILFCCQILLQAVQVQATEHQTVLHQTTSNCPLPPCQEIQVKSNPVCPFYNAFYTFISLRWSQSARTKVDTFVEFPLSGLDMSSYLIRNLSSTRYSNANSCLYDLAAVIVHHGNGMGSGMRELGRECFLHNQWIVKDTTLHLRRTARPGLTSTTWTWRRRISRMCRAPRPTSCSTSRGTSTEPWTAEADDDTEH